MEGTTCVTALLLGVRGGEPLWGGRCLRKRSLPLSLPAMKAESGQCVRSEVPISRVPGDFLLHQALLLLAQLHLFKHKRGTVRLAWRGLRRKAECRPAKPAGCRFCGMGRRRSPPAWGRAAGGESTSCPKPMYY